MLGSARSRAGTATASDVNEVLSMSTTKALLLSIAVPRVYRIYIPPKEVVVLQDDDDETVDETVNGDPSKLDESSNKSQSLNSQEEVMITVQIQARNHSESLREHDIGYVENEDGDDSRNSIVEHVVTAEEMAAIIKIDLSEEKEEEKEKKATIQEKEDKPEVTEEKPPEVAIYTSSTASIMSEAIRTFFGVVNKDEEQATTVYMNKEEAVAAIKKYDPLPKKEEEDADEDTDADEDEDAPNTEIKVEALLRMTFKNLYAEGHFYNPPIYTDIQSRLKDGDPDDWVEIAVMVKDSSIGIILERLERIGVGSSVGTIAIFKAELCRTIDITKLDACKKEAEESNAKDDEDIAEARAASIEAARAEWKNAASRLRVEQVKEQIHEQAQLDLDFLALLTIASILAGIGLIVNSTVVIVASMLVSPIMGPVMGMVSRKQTTPSSSSSSNPIVVKSNPCTYTIHGLDVWKSRPGLVAGSMVHLA
jgi:hypothetical protein